MISIRRFRKTDTYHVALLVSETYSAFNRTEGARKAVSAYIDFYDPKCNLEEIRRSFSRTPVFFVAMDGVELVGMIRGFDDRIENLFVRGDHHRIGVGSKLLAKYENVCARRGIKSIKVRASLYSMPFYQACGYKKTTGVRNLRGLRIQPMRKAISTDC